MKLYIKKMIMILLAFLMIAAIAHLQVPAKQAGATGAEQSSGHMAQLSGEPEGQLVVDAARLSSEAALFSLPSRSIHLGRMEVKFTSFVANIAARIFVLLFIVWLIALILSADRFHSESVRILTYIHLADGKKKRLPVIL